MKTYKKVLLAIAALIIIGLVYVATHAEKILLNSLKSYPIKIEQADLNDYQYDFKYLAKLLDVGFPAIDRYFPEKQRLESQKRILNILGDKDADIYTFELELNRYLANFNNSHTQISVKTEARPIYPYIIYTSHNKWFLLDIDKRFGDKQIGLEIVAINGQSVEKIEKELFKFVGAENKISRQAELRYRQVYRKPIYLKSIGLITDLTDNLEITFKDNSAITLKPQKLNEINFYDNGILKHPITEPFYSKPYFYKIYKEQNYAYLQFNHLYDKGVILDGMKDYLKPWLRPLGSVYLKYLFSKKKASGPIVGKYNPEYPFFKDFLTSMVKDLNSSGVENLIIDLRYNSGGEPNLGTELAYFLSDQERLKGLDWYAQGSDFTKYYFPRIYDDIVKKYPQGFSKDELLLFNSGSDLFKTVKDADSLYYIPKDRPIFKGKVYVFARFTTHSAAAMTTTVLLDNGLATVIGTNVGNNPTGPSQYTPYKLPKTKSTGSISSAYLQRPNKDAGDLLEPDFWIEYSVDDFINNKDPFLEKALELIKAPQ